MVCTLSLLQSWWSAVCCSCCDCVLASRFMLLLGPPCWSCHTAVTCPQMLQVLSRRY